MKLKWCLLIILVILVGCSVAVEAPTQEESIKNLDTLVSCLGHSISAYQALGSLPTPNIDGQARVYDLPDKEGYFSGFNFKVIETNGIAETFYIGARTLPIVFNEIEIPVSRQDFENKYYYQSVVMFEEYSFEYEEVLQVFDDEYVYVFFFRDNIAHTIKVTTSEFYEQSLIFSSEVIGNTSVNFEKIDNAIIANYSGKYSNRFRQYLFDCKVGEDEYGIVFYGYFNSVEILFGRKDSQAFKILSIDIVKDTYIYLTNAPQMTKDDIMLIRFRDNSGQEHEVEFKPLDNEVLMKHSIDERSKNLDNGQLIIDRLKFMDSSGNDHDFIITVDDKEHNLNCYLYYSFENDLDLVAIEEVANLENLDGLISNPRYHKGDIYYSKSDTLQTCATGLHFKTIRVEGNSFAKAPFFSGSIEVILEEFDDPYQDYFIVRRYLFDEGKIEMQYYLVSPEGQDVVFLGNYIDSIFLVEQIEQALS